MSKVTVHLNSTLHHFSQLLAGLEFLQVQKKIELHYIFDPGNYPVNIFKLEVDGKNVFFDLADHSGIDPVIYSESDHYIKRMLLRSDHQTRKKLIPYGLYYPVYYRSTFLKELFLKHPSWLKYSIRYIPILSQILNLKESIATNELSMVQSFPAEGEKIIFRSRVWDAGEDHPEWKREKRTVLNEQRIQINRLMQSNFRSYYTGGIRTDAFARREYPDFVLPPGEYHRRKYLLELQRCSIGIASPGLEESIGAKVGEYLANGLAIVTNPIEEFELLGPLKEGEHFLTYNSPEECVEKVKHLFSNDRLRKIMQQANREYYENWLHPGAKVMKILQRIERS